MVTVNRVVDRFPSTSLTDNPVIKRVASSSRVREPGTVFKGGSFTGVTVMFTVAVAAPPFPSLMV